MNGGESGPDGGAFDVRSFLPYLLAMAGEEASLSFQKIYKERYAMLRSDWRVLFHLGIYGAMTAKEISERARLHKTKVSRAVYRLSERRYISRETQPGDRRFETLALTSAGRAVYEDLRNVAREYEARLTSHMSEGEVESLKLQLSRIAGVEPRG